MLFPAGLSMKTSKEKEKLLYNALGVIRPSEGSITDRWDVSGPGKLQ